MKVEFTLINNPAYIEQPQGLLGWLGWFTLLAIGVILLRKWRTLNRRMTRLNWGILLALTILVMFTSLFGVVRLSADQALPPPGRPVEPLGPALVIFAALPMVLGAGFLGPLPAAGLGFFTGLLLGLWDTHSPFTALEYALIAILLGAAFNQRYRTQIFRALRHPLVSCSVLVFVYPLMFVIDMLFVTGGNLANRLDYALTHVFPASISFGVQLLVAGLFAEVIAAAFAQHWGSIYALAPSPVERKLEIRFIVSMTSLAVILILALMIGDWIVAGNAAKRMLQSQMAGTAQMAAESVPYFLESGQNLIKQLANNASWQDSAPGEISEVLKQSLKVVPFFRQLYYLDIEGNSIAGYPAEDFYLSSPAPEELVGIDYAKLIPIQYFTIPPVDGESSAQVSFIATVNDQDNKPSGVLIGRSDLASNPFTQPVLSGLENFAGLGGTGILLDEQRRILYNTSGVGVMEVYLGPKIEEASFYEDTAPDGTRQLVYSIPALGEPWSILLTIPAREAQQLALNIAAPLLAMVIVLFLVAGIGMRFALGGVTGSLASLADEANRIAGGQLDHPLQVSGVDELGQLRRSFEQMRISLQARLEELNRLLIVSQGVASSLEMDVAVQPILDSALSTGACSARVALASAAFAEIEGGVDMPMRFGAGPASGLFDGLDEQILTLTRQQDRVILTNLNRVRLLTFMPGVPRPEALIALALRHENTYYGTLWLAYDVPHQFLDDETRFLTTLAGHAALAAANTRLFLTAEVGRQRLAAILASTPEPVLVTDYRNNLLLANPAAWQMLGWEHESGEGQPLEQAIKDAELVNMLTLHAEDKVTAEITMPDNKVYLATASSVQTDGRRVGRICMLRDVTRLKELNTLKSEFVATVSHDLRSPLTLMRGYATMLEMVGELNEQQSSYVRKILVGVESMTRLVNNLLDLGRIEAGIDLQLEMVPVQEIIERVTGAIQLQAAQKHIHLINDVPPHTVPLVEADPALLQQALHNLVENAIKYTEPGGEVTVRVRTREDRLVFEVKDTGIGIAPVDQPRLFEKFYRGVQRESKKTQGSGLGLAIVKSIAERHNGKVWVESQLGKGSTFYLAIPLRQLERKSTPQRLQTL